LVSRSRRQNVVASAKWAQEIHIILDNLSAHKTKAVAEFLEANPKVRFHFTSRLLPVSHAIPLDLHGCQTANPTRSDDMTGTVH